MEIEKAKRILVLLADGIDPLTGETLPKESPYQHPDVVRALYTALMALDRSARAEAKKQQLSPNAGQLWSLEEEQELIKGFERGLSLLDLAKKHGRTIGAIRRRLVRLGKLKK